MQHQPAHYGVMQPQGGRIAHQSLLMVLHNAGHNGLKIRVLKGIYPAHQHIIDLGAAHLTGGHQIGQVVVVAVRCRADLRNTELIPTVILFHSAPHLDHHIRGKQAVVRIVPQFGRQLIAFVSQYQIQVGGAVFGLFYIAFFQQGKALAHAVWQLLKIHIQKLLRFICSVSLIIHEKVFGFNRRGRGCLPIVYESAVDKKSTGCYYKTAIV